MHRFLAIVLLLFLSNELRAQDTIVIEDLRYSWIQLDNAGMSPAGNPSSLNLIAFLLNQNQGSLLKICNDEPIDIWVNMKMIENEVSACIVLDLDSLEELMQTDSMFFHVTSHKGLSKLSTEVLTVVNRLDESVEISLRSDENFSNFYIISSLLLLLSIGFVRKFYRKRFVNIFLNPFKARGSTIDEYYSDFFRAENISFICMFSLLVSLFIQYLEISNYQINLGSAEVFDFVVSHGIKFGFVLGFILSKHLLGVIVSSVFNLRSISNIHNQDFLNYFFWIFVIAFVGSISEFSIGYIGAWSIAKYLVYIITFMTVLFQFGIYMKMSKIISAKKILIISYLCTTEFIPGFILIYVLLR